MTHIYSMPPAELRAEVSEGGGHLYGASFLGVSVAGMPTIDLALHALAAAVGACAQLRDPLRPRACLTDEPPEKRLAAATDAELRDARGCLFPPHVPQALQLMGVRGYATVVGDCVAMLSMLPPEVRAGALEPHGLELRGDHNAQKSLAELRRGGQVVARWMWLHTHMLITNAPDAEGNTVAKARAEVHLLVPEIMWANMHLDPPEPPADEPPLVKMRSLNELVAAFMQAGAREWCERLAIYPPAVAPPQVEHQVGPLLGYVAAVLRWMLESGAASVEGTNMDHPLYALGMSLMRAYGFEHGREVLAFARTEWDRLRAVDVLEANPARCVQPPAGGPSN